MAMVEDSNARSFRPRFVIDETGITEYSDAPLIVSAPKRDEGTIRRNGGTTGLDYLL